MMYRQPENMDYIFMVLNHIQRSRIGIGRSSHNQNVQTTKIQAQQRHT